MRYLELWFNNIWKYNSKLYDYYCELWLRLDDLIIDSPFIIKYLYLLLPEPENTTLVEEMYISHMPFKLWFKGLFFYLKKKDKYQFSKCYFTYPDLELRLYKNNKVKSFYLDRTSLLIRQYSNRKKEYVRKEIKFK